MMRLPRLAVLVLSLALAGGARAFAQGAEGAERGAGTPADAVEMTLEEAVGAALENNPAMARAEAGLEGARASRLAAWGGFLPSASARYSFRHSDTGRIDATGQGIVQTSHALSLSASYDLFTGFRRNHELRAAGLSLDAERASYVESEYATVLDVKTAYYAAVAAADLVRVQSDRVDRQRDQLEFVSRQLALGRATRSDSLRSVVDLNNARLALLTAENDARQSTYALAEAVGTDRPVAPSGTTLDVGPVPIDRETALARVTESSPAVTAARASSLAAEASAAAARSAWYPSFAVGADQSWQDENFFPQDDSWSVSASISYPLFNGFQRESSIQRARAQADAAAATLRETTLSTTAAVDAAWGQIEAARAGVALADETVELAREDLRVTEERYRVGLATILDLQASQIALREAEVDRIQRRFDHALGVARLEALLGRTFE